MYSPNLFENALHSSTSRYLAAKYNCDATQVELRPAHLGRCVEALRSEVLGGKAAVREYLAALCKDSAVARRGRKGVPSNNFKMVSRCDGVQVG